VPEVRRLAPVAVVAGAVLLYALVALANGAPRFPTRAECIHPATHAWDVVVVFGYFDSTQAAEQFRAGAEHSGFPGLRVERNACGRVKVVLPGVPSLKVGREVVGEAATVDIHATLEQGG
jgi:hypothetical protein